MIFLVFKWLAVGGIALRDSCREVFIRRAGADLDRLARSGKRGHCLYVKTVLLSHFYIKTIILPRQARDKHWENSKKHTVLLQTGSMRIY